MAEAEENPCCAGLDAGNHNVELLFRSLLNQVVISWSLRRFSEAILPGVYDHLCLYGDFYILLSLIILYFSCNFIKFLLFFSHGGTNSKLQTPKQRNKLISVLQSKRPAHYKLTWHKQSHTRPVWQSTHWHPVTLLLQLQMKNREPLFPALFFLYQRPAIFSPFVNNNFGNL